MNFTVEETNLICVFDTSERLKLISDLRESLKHDMEPEMRQLTVTCIRRLEALTDEEYAGVDLTADYDDFEDEAEV